MMRAVPPFALVLLLAACGTPQENCISSVTREIAVVDRLIAETEANIARGYALEYREVDRPAWVPCVQGIDKDGRPIRGRCFEILREEVRRPVALDLEAEARKLSSTKARRAEMARAASPAVAECRRLHPE